MIATDAKAHPTAKIVKPRPAASVPTPIASSDTPNRANAPLTRASLPSVINDRSSRASIKDISAAVPATPVKARNIKPAPIAIRPTPRISTAAPRTARPIPRGIKDIPTSKKACACCDTSSIC